jgi:hypothetical protein
MNNATVRIIRAIPTSNNSPGNEGPGNAFDNNPYTKYLNFDKQNAGVTVQLNVGRVVTSFKLTTANDAVERDPTSYKLYGSNDGSTWTLIQQGTLALSDNRFSVSNDIPVTNSTAYVYYFMIFPSIKNNAGNSVQIAEITYFYDANNTTTSTDLSASGSTPVDPVQAASAPQYPSYVTVGGGSAGNMTFNETTTISATKQNKIDTWTNKTVTGGNSIYIDQVGGSGNTVTMDQEGSKNKITTTLDGSTNAITVKQGTQGIGQNEIKLGLTGSDNTINISQARTDQGLGTGTNGHYHDALVNGSNNTVTARQGNTGGVGGHYMETTINGNQNNIVKKQTDNGNKIMFTSISGNNNTVEAVQKGTGQHYLESSIAGSNNTLSAVQEGSITNRATVDMTNAGGPASVIVNQTGGQNVTVTTTCATAGGCSPITVRQGY